jgi:spore coat polysaccharide biosynthesis predicted glycosyltransferase SpsG
LANSEWEVRVAIGSAAASLPALEELAECADNVAVLRDCENMADEMLTADIMIGAGGTTSWERATLGLPCLLVIAADNQRANAKLLAEQGAARVLGDAETLEGQDIFAALDALRQSRADYETMCTSASNLCDGKGTERAAAAVWERLAG